MSIHDIPSTTGDDACDPSDAWLVRDEQLPEDPSQEDPTQDDDCEDDRFDDNEPVGSLDGSDDEEAMASAGHGEDESYGCFGGGDE